MAKKDLATRLYYYSCLFVLFFVAAAASFNGYYDKWRLLDTDISGSTQGKNNFEPMMDGTAERPFVYRQLLPMLANWIDRQVPEQCKDRLFAAKSQSGILFREYFFSSPIAQDRVYFFRYWIVYALVFLFALISVFAMYFLCKSVGSPPSTAAEAAIVMILLMPYFLTVGGYIYDYPELAFLALTVWMALNLDWWWAIPVVALATWNKESFLLFSPSLYPLLRQRGSRISALSGTGILGLTCAVVYGMLRLRFQHNPGKTVYTHLADQVNWMLHPANSFLWEKNYGVIAIKASNPLVMALIAWTVWRGWRYLPRVIQRHAMISAVINFPLFLLFCGPGELRNLSFLYLSFLLLMAVNLDKRGGNQSKPSIPQSA
ncbi:MAG TPA: hypothetical protein VGT08_17290 [Terracidiphilus sp.]|nr:hypothetical protein [Terracidiphilus sp.]